VNYIKITSYAFTTKSLHVAEHQECFQVTSKVVHAQQVGYTNSQELNSRLFQDRSQTRETNSVP